MWASDGLPECIKLIYNAEAKVPLTSPVLLMLQFMVHSDMGRIVREICDEFQRNPPKFLSSANT